MEEIKKNIEEILANVYEAGKTKSKGSNPYHWFNEEKDIFTKQIINCFSPRMQVLVDDTWVPAKEEPYYPLGLEWLKCKLGFHELVISKRYRATKYCFRCGIRKTGFKHY